MAKETDIYNRVLWELRQGKLWWGWGERLGAQSGSKDTAKEEISRALEGTTLCLISLI